MTTHSQLIANRKNALHSTGPRTEAGKAASSRNHLTLGLYTKTDYVKPGERLIYANFCQTMRAELNPACLLEETLVSEITAASWRLRHCDAADAGLTDFDDATDKLRRSVERARARSTSVLHRGIDQLRRLQSGRSPELASNCITAPDPIPDLDLLTQPPPEFLEELDAVLAEYAALGSNCKPQAHAAKAASAQAPELGSNCKPGPRPAQIPRSAPCPCGSREKYKRCCGKNAPPVLGKAA